MTILESFTSSLGEYLAAVRNTFSNPFDQINAFVALYEANPNRAMPLGDTRTTVGSYRDLNGYLQSALPGVVRYDYDPYTKLTTLLREPARTNVLRNPLAVGAIAGAPGTMPTFWTMVVAPGLARTIIGTGVQNGMPYVDLGITGTCTTAGSPIFKVDFDTVGGAASNGQVWTASTYVQLLRDTSSRLVSSLMHVLTNVSTPTTYPAEPIGTPRSLTRVSSTIQTSNQNITSVYSGVWSRDLAVVGSAYNVAIRIALPQLEIGNLMTSVITPAAGATGSVYRDADNPFSVTLDTTRDPQGYFSLQIGNATAALIRQGVLVELARACADYEPASTADVVDILNRVIPLYDREVLYLGDALDTNAFSEFRNLRAAVATDLNARGANLPDVIDIDIGGSLSALTLSNRLYRDGRFADDLIRRVDPIHPLFMDSRFRALAP